MKFDDLIINYLGEFGTYQRLQFLAVCLPTVVTAMHAFTWIFAAIEMPHRCRLPTESKNASFWLSDRSPYLKMSDKCDGIKCYYKQCTFDELDHCPHGLVYDHSTIGYNAINKWDIACQWQPLKPVIQSSYYVGQMIGSLVFGFLGDRIGRKKVFFIAILLQIISGFFLIIAPYWAMYGALRVIVGAAHPGVFMITVVIGMELVGPSKRKIASIMAGVFFSIGEALLGVAAYYFQNDYRILQAAIAIPSLFFLSYWWIVPESARWLISQRRFAEADAVLQRVARANKTQLPEKWWEEIETPSTETKAAAVAVAAMADEEKQTLQNELRERRRHNFFDLLRTPRIRRISLAVFFCWPIVSMIFYGMAMKPTFLGGNIYSNFIFGSLMEIPSVLFIYVVLDKVGRKPVLAAGFVIAAVCTISNLLVDNTVSYFAIPQYLVSKGAITAVYACMYTYTPELFPTVIRNIAMGVCSMMARVGAILSSFISMWLTQRYGNWVMIVPFSIFGLLAALVIMTCLPETMSKELSETIEELEGQNRAYELQPLQAHEKKQVPSKDDLSAQQ